MSTVIGSKVSFTSYSTVANELQVHYRHNIVELMFLSHKTTVGHFHFQKLMIWEITHHCFSLLIIYINIYIYI